MTPAARISAAIQVLDHILAGEPAERALTNWGRASRFAGSGDRAALRDLVFDALRCKRSFAALGDAMTGRGLMLGRLRARGEVVDALFTGEGHAPAVVTADDVGTTPSGPAALDCPDWLYPMMESSLGPQTDAILSALQSRAPVFVRVNLARMSREDAILGLAREGVLSQPHPLAKSALEVIENARKIQNSPLFLDGLIELQDAASQAVVAALPLTDGMRVLDYCAGGGGKTLAMAARAKLALWAHDANPRRMTDLVARADRAQVSVSLTDNPARTAPYDLILADVPCSGSGSWRRDPEGKWSLTPERLTQTITLQSEILDRIAPMVAANGWLAYATCSLLHAENEGQIQAFLARHPDWMMVSERRFDPLTGGDGFFVSILTRK